MVLLVREEQMQFHLIVSWVDQYAGLLCLAAAGENEVCCIIRSQEVSAMVIQWVRSHNLNIADSSCLEVLMEKMMVGEGTGQLPYIF